jgi:hypothetical protein
MGTARHSQAAFLPRAAAAAPVPAARRLWTARPGRDARDEMLGAKALGPSIVYKSE